MGALWWFGALALLAALTLFMAHKDQLARAMLLATIVSWSMIMLEAWV